MGSKHFGLFGSLVFCVSLFDIAGYAEGNENTLVKGVALCGLQPCERVWLDMNDNRVFDVDEPTSIPDKNGQYELQGQLISNGPLVVATRHVGSTLVTLFSSPGVADITPLTTLTEAKRVMASFSDKVLTTREAAQYVSDRTKVSPEGVLSGYSLSQASRARQSATAIWRVLEKFAVANAEPDRISATSALASQWAYNFLPAIMESDADSEGQPSVLVTIPPAPTGRKVIKNYEGMPQSIRRHFPYYTNAYISSLPGFDYKQGIAIIGTKNVSEEEMLNTRDIVNAMLLAMPQVRSGLVEYQSYIGVLEGEPDGDPDDPDSELAALMSLRPIELIYTQLDEADGQNETGINGSAESVTHHLMQVFAYYALNNATQLKALRAQLLDAYANSIAMKLYEPEDKYLDDDPAHMDILTAPGAYLALAADRYFGIDTPVNIAETEYHVADKNDMEVKDPMMFTILSTHFDAEWFNYDAIVRGEGGYEKELRRLEKQGVLDLLKQN